MLGMDEADLWPQLRDQQSWSEEVQAVYPHRDAVPSEVWLQLFATAEREISVLDRDALFLAKDNQIRRTLCERARSGTKLRICLADPATCGDEEPSVGQETSRQIADAWRAFALYAPLRETGRVEIRLHRTALYNHVYRADDELLVAQVAYGVAAGHGPVLRLRYSEEGGLAGTYVHSFDQVWAHARIIQ
jgi:hypothetical protein